MLPRGEEGGHLIIDTEEGLAFRSFGMGGDLKVRVLMSARQKSHNRSDDKSPSSGLS